MNGNLFWSDVMELDMVRAHKVAGLGPKYQSSFSWVCIAFDWVDRHCVGQDTAIYNEYVLSSIEGPRDASESSDNFEKPPIPG